MRHARFLALPLLGLLLAAAQPACDPTGENPTGDEPTRDKSAAVESSSDSANLPADPGLPAEPETLAAYSNSTYFIVTHMDMRRCAYPYCGGYFSKRVNQATTTCSDGTAQPECRILEFDYAALSLDPAALSKLEGQVQTGRALLRGQIVKTAPIAGRTFDKLVVREAWEARSISPAPSPVPTLPTGTYSRLRQLPVACPACPPYRQEALNTSAAAVAIAKLAFDASRFPATVVKEIETALPASDVGLLMAGTRGGSSGSPQFAVSEAYTPVKGPRVGKVGDACGSRGTPPCEASLFCKWERSAMCGRAAAAGVCSVKPSVCIKVYMPVCGCDRKTYGNECEAHSAGVAVDYDGVCR